VRCIRRARATTASRTCQRSLSKSRFAEHDVDRVGRRGHFRRNGLSKAEQAPTVGEGDGTIERGRPRDHLESASEETPLREIRSVHGFRPSGRGRSREQPPSPPGCPPGTGIAPIHPENAPMTGPRTSGNQTSLGAAPTVWRVDVRQVVARGRAAGEALGSLARTR
jgi:hypothetical protein